VLIVRLKQLEHALADGRLDAGFELARSTDLRADRRGAELANRLAHALIERGKEHADAGRIPEAVADCEKAQSLAGNLTELAQLRAAVSDATSARMNTDRLRALQFAAAKKQIDAGQLTIAQNLLSEINKDPRSEELNHDLAARQAQLRSAVAKASAALASNDWEAAVDHLAGLCRRFPADDELNRLALEINKHAATLISTNIESGRLDLASLHLSHLDRLDRSSAAIAPLRRTLHDCRTAFDLIAQGNAAQAIEILRRAALLWPDAAWLNSASTQLKQLSDGIEELRSGPLGLIAHHPASFDPHETLPMPQTSKPANRHVLPPPANKGQQNGRFVLHVDGVGSYQVIDQPVVTIGPIGSTARADVAILAGAGVPPITITRTDGDYFLQSRQPVQVNEKPATAKLLCSGDKIAIGPRAQIVFRRPSAASGTAILDLTTARLSRGDIRQVILLDREILIGPGSTAHVRCDALSQTGVLQQNGGNLFLRSADSIQIDGRPATSPAAVTPGSHVQMGTLSFVIGKD